MFAVEITGVKNEAEIVEAQICESARKIIEALSGFLGNDLGPVGNMVGENAIADYWTLERTPDGLTLLGRSSNDQKLMCIRIGNLRGSLIFSRYNLDETEVASCDSMYAISPYWPQVSDLGGMASKPRFDVRSQSELALAGVADILSGLIKLISELDLVGKVR